MNDTVENFRYQTWELDDMVLAIERPNPFLLNKFFRTVKLSDAATIEWDIQEGGRRLAPFVSPFVAGQPVRTRGHRTDTLRPAYIKPTALITPQSGFVRRPGEPYGGNMTPKQRIDAKLAEQLAEHEDMLDNRLEWMAASALVNSSILIEGESYSAKTVDFGRHADLEVSLAGAARWSQAGAEPLNDIEEMALDIRRYSYGAVSDTVVMDGLAWGFFRKRMEDNVNFQAEKRLGSSQIESGPRNNIDGEFVGRLGGRFDIWVYDGHYEDNAGEMQPYLPAYTALVVSSAGIDGRRYFGAIQDLHADLIATRMFHKTKEKWDPSGVELVSQSAPLVAPKRPNSYGRLTVHSP